MLFADALFNIFAGVFDVLNDVRQNVAVVLLFLYSIIPNLDAIIRVRMLLCESSMLLFVSICCYAKARCYYSCPYAVIPNLDANIRVSNYVSLNPGLQRARPLWSGASDKLIMPILPPEGKFMLLSMAEVTRNCLRTVNLEQLASPNLDSDSQESVFDRVETLYNTVESVQWDNIIML